MAGGNELLLKRVVVFNDSVVDDENLVVAVAVRVGV